MRLIAQSFCLLVGIVPSMHAQVQRGAIRGTVHDALSGRAIGGVQLVVKNTDIRATTDTTGRFLLAGVWPGTTEVEARRILFRLSTTTVTVTPGDTTDTEIELSLISGSMSVDPDAEAVALGRVETNATAVSSRMAAFDQRRARGGGGSYITRADIERRHPNVLSEMLRSIAGLSITNGAFPGAKPSVQIERSAQGISSGACEVQLYVDGHPYPRGSVDDFPPETVEGLEIYRGGAQLPSDFRTGNAGCGLIAIWTRDPTAIKRQP